MIVFLYSGCKTKSKENNNQETKLEFEIFAKVPDEIDGGCCLYSKNEKDLSEEKYIYANNFTNYSLIKIQGEIRKFMLLENSKPEDEIIYYIYKYEELTLRVDVTQLIIDGYESSKVIGKMTLTDKNGRKSVQEFVGVCGSWKKNKLPITAAKPKQGLTCGYESFS